MTEVCLKVILKTSLPLNPDLLINYDLPTQKASPGSCPRGRCRPAHLPARCGGLSSSSSADVRGRALFRSAVNLASPSAQELYLRRITAVLGGRASAGGVRVAVHFAVAGRLGEFAAVESFAERQIEQMPVHVADVLQRDRGA